MAPATISEWIDQTRQLLEDDLIDCKAAAIDTVTYQLDAPRSSSCSARRLQPTKPGFDSAGC